MVGGGWGLNVVGGFVSQDDNSGDTAASGWDSGLRAPSSPKMEWSLSNKLSQTGCSPQDPPRSQTYVEYAPILNFWRLFELCLRS